MQGLIKKLTPLLCSNIDNQIKRVGNRKASLIIFDGGVGSGKTHGAVNTADYIQGSEVELNIQYAMGGDQFEQKLSSCVQTGKKVIIYDEAGDFSRRGAITSFNRRLNRIFETYRTFEIVILLVLPCMDVLDSQIFLNKIPRLLVNCHNKVQGKYTRFRAYSLYRMFWLKRRFKELTVKPQAYTRVRSNFRGLLRPLSPDRAEAVDNLSTMGKRAELDKGKKIYNKNELAEIMGKSPAYVIARLNQLKVKPAKKKGITNYYYENVTDLFY